MTPDTGQHRGDDGADSVADRARVHHLAGDAEPADTVTDADLAELDDLRALLADPTLWAEPPASLEDSVVALIATEAAQRPATGSTTTRDHTPAAAQDDLAAARAAKAARDQRPPLWRRTGVLVAAAVAVVAVAFSAVLLLQNSSAQPRFDVALAATDLAPGSSGTADMVRTDSGWKITLHATGLPRLDGGNFYQAWLRNADGVLVPIGTFNEGTNVTLWAGVSPRDFRTMTITRETADGKQDSSGQRVLVGDVTQE